MQEKIREIVSQALDIPLPEVRLDSNLKNDLGCDSIDLVELTMVIEEEFDIGIPDEIVAKFDNVEDLVNAVKTLKQTMTYDEALKTLKRAQQVSWKSCGQINVHDRLSQAIGVFKQMHTDLEDSARKLNMD